jgi:hypothetical protein
VPGERVRNLGRRKVRERSYLKIDDAQHADFLRQAQLDLRVGELIAHG